MHATRSATINNVLDQTWSKDNFRSENLDRAIGPRAEMFYSQMRQLGPRTEFQHAVHAQLLEMGAELGQKRSFLLEQTGGSIPNTLSRSAGFLAHADFRRLWLIRTYKLDRHRNPGCLRAIGCGGYFPNSGTGPPVRRANADFCRTASQRASTSRQIAASGIRKRDLNFTTLSRP
jgi:hypothetical protein